MYPKAQDRVMKGPHVVIVGAGFSGLQAVKALRKAPVDVTVIDHRNHHLFQPLLYQVATSTLSGADIAVSIRSDLKKQRNARVLLDEVNGVDRQGKRVLLRDGRALSYDYLILATGSRQSYFGHEEWEKFALGLKSISDANTIRDRILAAFEKAEIENDPERRKRLMTVVLVGGGPTGVELAGAIAYLVNGELRSEYRNIDVSATRIVLIDRGPRLLSSFSERLSLRAKEELERSGIEIRLNASVEQIDSEGVSIGEERIPAEVILWTAGVVASPAGKWLDAETDRSGRVVVAPDLSVPGSQEIFVIGDSAHLEIDGKLIPGLAPAAMQEGRYVGKRIAQKVTTGRVKGCRPFHYQDKGNLATLGKIRAVAEFKGVHTSGFWAWALWATVHVFYLIGFRSRLIVLLKWAFLFSFSHSRESLIVSERMKSGNSSDLTDVKDMASHKAHTGNDSRKEELTHVA